jgi:hypothetical protein
MPKMSTRIECACAGFLLTNGVSYLISLCLMISGEKNYLHVGWGAMILGAFVSLSSGVYLLLGGRHARIAAAIACLFFLTSSVSVLLFIKQLDFPPLWQSLLTPVSVCSLLCLIFFIVTRREQGPK